MNRRILVIEDERDIADLLKLHLSDVCSEVVLAFDGTRGLEQALSGHWDLIILDLRLPGVDGLQICRRVREGSAYTPILMLTSKSSELDRVLGLELGADDYLTKPFSILELLARVKAIFRRVESLVNTGEHSPGFINYDGLFIDAEKRTVRINGDAIDLTAKEFDLLVHFARHPGKVYTRTQLLDSVWGYGHEGYEHTVNSHINRLRGKIELDPAVPKLILTVWGVGYKFSDTLGPGN
jgi:DNA-binding response OmpR family regulator